MILLYDLDGHVSTEVLNITLETKMNDSYNRSISFGINNYKISHKPSTEVGMSLIIEYNTENIKWVKDWYESSYMSISKGIRTICIGDRTFYGCRILSFDNDHEYNYYNGEVSKLNIDLLADHFEVGTDFQSSWLAYKRDITISKILDE